MMLGPHELQRRLNTDIEGKDRLKIVPSPNSTGHVDNGAAAIDLRLGRWFLALQQTRTNEIDFARSRNVDEFEAKEGKHTYVPFGEKYIIHSGRFVLASTMEWIKVPPDLGGHITGRSSIGRRGLIIETAAGLHPNFSGCITLELSNCGEVPVGVTPGMRICQVFLHELEGYSLDSKTNFGGRRRPTFGHYNLDVFVQRATDKADGKGRQRNLFGQRSYDNRVLKS